MDSIFTNPLKDAVFVFGSNLSGQHSKGAADFAVKYYGAKYGQGEGFSGQSYALPTKDHNLRTLPLSTVQAYVRNFLSYARERRDLFFMVTRVGCGLAGYKDEDIVQFFSRTPDNVWLPGKWLMKLNHLDRARLIVDGDHDFLDSHYVEQSLISGTQFWNNKLEVITNTLEGPGPTAAVWGRKEGLPWTPFPVDTNRFGVDAEKIGHHQMAWYSTHAMVYWDGLNHNTKSFIDCYNREGLRVKVNTIMSSSAKLELVG